MSTELGTRRPNRRSWRLDYLRRRPRAECLEARLALDSTVVFSELMYHPANDQPAVEWVELHNQMAIDMDLSDWRLEGGVEFQLDAGTVVPGGGYLLVSSDPSMMSGVPATARIVGPFTGRLANDGEEIRLVNNSDRLMDSLNYGDGEPWPVGPDGSGMTLSKREKLSASDPAGNWTASQQRGGTPGSQNFADGDLVRVSFDVISPAIASRIHVPRSNALGDTWTSPSFREGRLGETWTTATSSVGFSATIPVDYAQDVTSDQPLGYWRFGESSVAQSATNLGIAGNAAAGTFFRSAALGQPSLLGQAGDFSLATSASDPQAVMSTGEFEKSIPRGGVGGTGRTLEFWTRLDELPSSMANLVGDGQGTLDFGFMVYVTPSGRLRSFVRTTSSANFGITAIESQQSLTVGQIHHVVATWDQPSGGMRIFLDGIELSTDISEGVLPNWRDPRNTTNPLFVGRDERDTGGVDAVIDELAVYNYALPADRVSSHFKAGQQGLTNVITTDVSQSMHTVASSAYLRIPFQVSRDIEIDQFAITLRYNDGFVAYVNGTEVARRNAPSGPLSYDSVATVQRSNAAALSAETFDLSAFADLLRPGSNLLAIQGLNSSGDDSTFLIEAHAGLSGFPSSPTAPPPLVLNEIGSALDQTFRVELMNDSDTTVDLAGVMLVRASHTDAQFVFPAGTSIPPRGYVSLAESELSFDAAKDDRLFLFAPNRRTLIDAQRITNRLQARSPELDGRWQSPTAATFGAANQFDINDQIVINEIMYHARPRFASPDGRVSFAESSEEWIELYNRGTTAVDLSGWALAHAIDYVFPSGTTMPAGSYLVVAADAAKLAQKHPDIASIIVGDYSRELNDHDDLIQLIDQRGNLADEVHYYEGGRWPQFADGGGSSLELRDPHADNSNPAAWAPSTEHTRSQWQSYTYRGTAAPPPFATYPDDFHEFSFGLLQAGEVLIDDISVIEEPDGAARQFIQNGSFTGGFGSWRPVGNHLGQVVSDPDNPANDVFHLIATGPEEHMQNHVETTLKSGGQFVQVTRGVEYEISFRAKWLVGSPQLNTRLFFNFLPRTTILETPDSNGTPGAVNSRWQANIGPTHADLTHSPTSPAGGEPVLVTIAPSDPDVVASSRLWYSVDQGPFQSTLMTKTKGGTYLGTIPGQADGQIVQFYVESRDQRGARSVFPADGPASRALYRVGTPPASTTGLHNMQIIVLDSDESRLAERTNLMSNHQLGATVVYENQVFYDVGVRLKGSEHGRPDVNRRGFAIVFHPDQRFRGVHETIGIDRSGGWRFGRTFGQDEMLIHQFFNRAGNVPSMYNDLIYVDAPTVPEGTAILQLARFNDVFLDSQFENGSQGTAYEYELIYSMRSSDGVESLKFAQEGPAVAGVRVGTDLGDDKESYRHYFLLDNNRARDDFQPVISLAKAFRMTDTAFQQASRRVIDTDQWMRAFAALSLSGANDNYNAGSQHNAIFYQRPSDGKMLLFPFDMDFAFHLPSSAPLSQNTDLTRLLGDPNNEHAFFGHLLDIVSTSFNRSYMQRWVDYFDQLLPGQDFSSIISWIEDREAFALRRMPDEIDFEITTPDLTVDTPVAIIRGNGWVNVHNLTLRGVPGTLELNWVTPTQWEATVNLTASQQTLVVDAVDFRGRVVGSDSVTIASTALNPLVDSLRISEINFNPHGPSADELAVDPDLNNDDFEFIEVTNYGPHRVNLLNVRFIAGIDFAFSDQTLAPGQSGVIVNDAQAFALRYGNEVNVLGEYNDGRLSNGGERLTMIDPNGETIVDFVYQDGGLWPERADGVGATLVAVNPGATAASEFSKPYQWRGSVEFGGSPGWPSILPAGIVINEVLANTDGAGQSDAIELLNTSTQTVDISGWYLSDSARDLSKFVIPQGTMLAPGGRVVFDESDFNPTPDAPQSHHFALSGSRGDDVWLTRVDVDGRWFEDDVHFAGTRSNESLGRYPDGRRRLAPMSQVTLGTTNAAPRVGPVVVTEIHADASEPSAKALAIARAITSTDLDFIEIHNPSRNEIDLTNWRLQGSVAFDFSVGVLSGRQTALIVPFDPARSDLASAFRAHHAIVESFPLLGPYRGELPERFGQVVLQRSHDPLVESSPFVSRSVEDEVVYDDVAPWPTRATGSSLIRSSEDTYGNDGSLWSSDIPTPGVVGAGDLDQNGVVNADDIDALCRQINTGHDPRFDLNSDGQSDFVDFEFLIRDVLQTSLGDSNLDGRFDTSDLIRVFQTGEYDDNIVGNSGWSEGDWNCDLEFSSGDLIAAFQLGVGPVAAAVANETQIAAAVDALMDALAFSAGGTDQGENSNEVASGAVRPRILLNNRPFDDDELARLLFAGRAYAQRLVPSDSLEDETPKLGVKPARLSARFVEFK